MPVLDSLATAARLAGVAARRAVGRQLVSAALALLLVALVRTSAFDGT